MFRKNTKAGAERYSCAQILLSGKCENYDRGKNPGVIMVNGLKI